MREAAVHLTGTHDYESFRASGRTAPHARRTITHIEIQGGDLGAGGQGLVRLTFEGDGFVRHMIRNIVGTLVEVGLGYVHLGQSSTTLSGGEAQRIKLASELSKRATGKTLYLLDEPTTGLHFADVHKLLELLLRLRESGNTVVVIEHNLDVVKCADYIIDLGPGGGDEGGRLVAAGTPEEVAACEASLTGAFLRRLLAG